MSLDAYHRTCKRIEEMVAAGQLVEKLCFVHCGDRCNCVGGAFAPIYLEETTKEKNEFTTRETEEKLNDQGDGSPQ
jgi:hypothetical protein